MKSFFDFTPSELKDLIASMGEKKFRSTQILEWAYKKRVSSFEEMRNIPRALRYALAERIAFFPAQVVSRRESPQDRTRKYLFKSDEGHLYEAVLLRKQARNTLCVSSQIGCSLGCVFCETGRMGFVRNLSAGEILAQAAAVQADIPEQRITNIVFMGMGEALLNFDAFRQALRGFSQDSAFAIGRRRITVSTAGYVPGITRLIQEKIDVELAISLNASNDRERSALMPINQQYPLEDLVAAARKYARFRGRSVTFEYVLIHGKTDSMQNASEVVSLLQGGPFKVNLIPLNSCSDSSLASPPHERIQSFRFYLEKHGLTATIRISGGEDIEGACGQLAARNRDK
ncbi:MAG: 23S rRNA (adenine(2503)-C(2))-methyltransferase RlmN [Fibrobacterota bacterium]